MKKRELSYNVGGNVNWYARYGEQYGSSLKNYTWSYHVIQQTHSSEYIQRKTWLKRIVFIAALFTIARTWKLTKCPSTDEQIKMICMFIYIYICVCVYIYIYIHSGILEYYSAIRKNEIMQVAATWMNLEIIILSDVSQTEEDKYHMISLIWGIEKKMIRINLFTKQKQIHRLRK